MEYDVINSPLNGRQPIW